MDPPPGASPPMRMTASWSGSNDPTAYKSVARRCAQWRAPLGSSTEAPSRRRSCAKKVESECGAVAVGRAYLLPPLSSGGASLVRPWLRFHTPLIEPDMQICRIRLSDKTSRLHPRRAPTKPCEAYELEVPVKVREGITPALASPDLVLVPEPPAQPHSRVVVERAIRFAGGADTEVIGPPAKRAVQHVDELCGLLPATRSVGQRMDSFDHALDALL